MDWIELSQDMDRWQAVVQSVSQEDLELGKLMG
jgi:hypothetical protein